MISYGGVYLPCLDYPGTDDTHVTASSHILYEFAERTWPGKDLDALGFRGALPRRPVRMNSLFWPRTASRFSLAHYPCDLEGLNQIRSLAYQENTLNPLDLVINDGRHSITTEMYMLPPRPLERVENASDPSGLFMLTLVDHRYFWWFASGTLTITGATTWANMYTYIGNILGITITADTVSSAYLSPPTEMARSHDNIPQLLDAVAFSCGQTICRRLDGTVVALGASSSISTLTTNLSLASRLGGDTLDI